MANQDLDSLLDALADEDSEENKKLLADAERKFMQIAAELEPALNRVIVQARDFRRQYKLFTLAGGRPIPKYEELLARIKLLQVPKDMLPEVRTIQSAPAPAVAPAQPIKVETPFGQEMVRVGVLPPPPPVVNRPMIPHPVTGQPVPEPKHGIVKNGKSVHNSVDAREYAATIPLSDVAAFYNLVVEKFKRPPTAKALADYFGLSQSWAGQVTGKMYLRKMITVVRKQGDGYGPKDLTEQILSAFGTYKQKKGADK